MNKLLQINVSANSGSTGKIAEQIGLLAEKNGWNVWMAYGRTNNDSRLKTIRIGSDIDVKEHGFETRFFDNHGLASRTATKRFIEQIKEIKPDVIHLHNIHGYYLNYPILFRYLKEWGGPVVWTLHDCWPITGHCSYFMHSGCERWKTQCYDCPSLNEYPSSLLIDGSRRNFNYKKYYFSSIASQLTLVPVSNYVGGYIPESFLNEAKIEVIHNGIDLSVFKPYDEPKENLILGVANVWDTRKGLQDFYKLREILPSEFRILLVGLSQKQLSNLPYGVEGLTRTTNQDELARLYSNSLALVNPTYEDNYPTVNLEAIACGTPVITYMTGGSPESITNKTGYILKQGDVVGIANAVRHIADGAISSSDCRDYSLKHFSNTECFQTYINLYNHFCTCPMA